MAEESSYRLLFIDECEVHLNPPLTKIWAPKGEPARVPAAGNDQKVAVFGAWSFADGDFSYHLCENKNSDQFLAFLKQLQQQTSDAEQLLLVMDNAGYHRANKVEAFLQEGAAKMEPFWLPPYSPELNLIERVWKYLKENVTNNYFFGQLQNLIEATRQGCTRLASPDEKVLQVNFETRQHLSQAA